MVVDPTANKYKQIKASVFSGPDEKKTVNKKSSPSEISQRTNPVTLHTFPPRFPLISRGFQPS